MRKTELINKKLPVRILWLPILVAAVCCSQHDKPAMNAYFNVQELFSEQVSILDSLKPRLQKTLMIDGQTENNSLLEADSINWEQEFKIFREHDINKPVLLDAYQVQEDKTAQGDIRKSYRLKQGQSGVLSMDVVTTQSNQIGSWESVARERNLLYSNYRKVRLDFQPGSEGSVLKRYSIEGFHKLLNRDTVHYRLMAELMY